MLENNFTPTVFELYTKDGCVDRQKAIIAYSKTSKKVIAIGNEAEKYCDSAEIIVTNPYKQGIVQDFLTAEKIMSCFIKKYAKTNMFIKPKVAVIYSKEYSSVQRKAIEEMLVLGGAREVFIIDDSIEIPSDGFMTIIKEYNCQLLIKFTQDDATEYIRERATELVEYAKHYGVTVEKLIEMIRDTGVE